jgi:hypothetical protein
MTPKTILKIQNSRDHFLLSIIGVSSGHHRGYGIRMYGTKQMTINQVQRYNKKCIYAKK